MARAAFYLFAAGATLALLSLALVGGAGREETAIVAAALAAYALAAVYLVGFDRVPAWVFQATTIAASVLIAFATYFGGDTALAYPLFYLWVVLYALYFFGWPQAAMQIAFVVVACALVFRLLEDPRLNSASTLIAGGTLLVVGAMALLVKARLERQNERLRELDRQKDELVSLVSHELKTPLTSIRGYLDLMLRDAHSLPPEERRYLAMVDRNVDRLLHVLGDLLFLAQVDEKRLTLEIEAVDLAALVEETVEAFRPLADAKRITLESTLEPVPSFAGDPVRLSQVLDNLLSNAIKFTPAGGRVSARAFARGKTAFIEVADSGIGIPERDQRRVFERFFRASNADEQPVSGTGLGLPVAKAIAAAHRGELTLESEEGIGTTARIALPLGLSMNGRRAPVLQVAGGR